MAFEGLLLPLGRVRAGAPQPAEEHSAAGVIVDDPLVQAPDARCSCA